MKYKSNVRVGVLAGGIYRPAYSITFRAALDANNNLTAFHVKGGGIQEAPLLNASNFPAGVADNFLAENWTLNSNITTGSFRAPWNCLKGQKPIPLVRAIAMMPIATSVY